MKMTWDVVNDVNDDYYSMTLYGHEMSVAVVYPKLCGLAFIVSTVYFVFVLLEMDSM